MFYGLAMTKARTQGSQLTADQLIAAEVRAEMARQHVTQTELAREVFGMLPHFIQPRCAGAVPFSAVELLKVADYLGVDVVQFRAATHRSRASGGERREPGA